MTGQGKQIDPEEVARRATHYFVNEGRTCSEACLKSGAEALGIEDSLVPDIAIAFAGGIGMQGDVCGAVAGCTMALSLAAAQKTKDYPEQKKLAVPAAARIYREFAAKCGSARCKDICGLDLTTQEGISQLMAGVRNEKCAPAITEAGRLLGKELRQIAAS